VFGDVWTDLEMCERDLQGVADRVAGPAADTVAG
jgi:hypothetical protein